MQIDSYSDAEGGFTMLEVIVCVGLVVSATVIALGALPVLIRQSTRGIVRTAAVEVARNVLVRAEAAGTYLPPDADATATTRVQTTNNHTWAFVPAAAFSSAVSLARVWCGQTQITVNVTTTYDASTDLFRVNVAYPSDPCDATALSAQVTLAQRYAPALDPPGSSYVVPIADPQRQ